MTEIKETLLRHADLQFHSNAILTRGMLQELRDYPLLFTRLMWQDYSDGILSGLDFRQDGGEIILTPGIVRYGGEFYFLTRDVSLTELAEDYRQGRKTDTKFAFFSISPGKHSIIAEGVGYKALALNIGPEPGSGICLAAFSTQVSPRLPNPEAPGLFDEYTAPSRLQLLDCQYAQRGKAAFHPLVFSGMRCALARKERKSAADWALLMQLENNPAVSLGSLAAHARGAGIVWPENPDRREIFKSVCAAIDAEPHLPAPAAPAPDRGEKPAPEIKMPKVIR